MPARPKEPPPSALARTKWMAVLQIGDLFVGVLIIGTLPLRLCSRAPDS